MNLRKILLILSVGYFTGCDDNTDLNQATELYNTGKYKEAIEIYTEFVRLNPDSEIAFYNRGMSWQELGQFDKAIKDFETVLEINPSHTYAHISIGRDQYQRQKKYGLAIGHFNEALHSDPQNPEAYTIRGRSYQKLGELDKAMNDYNSAINVDRDYGEAYFSRGTLKLHEKNKKGACADFSLANSLGSENGENAFKKFCQ